MVELRGTPQELMVWLCRPGSDVERALGIGRAIPSQLLAYQQAALFILASRYNHPGAVLLDIGTAAGHSAALMTLAAPRAEIITLEPSEKMIRLAKENLAAFAQIRVMHDFSWDFEERDPKLQLDMVFVDGDHNRIARDMPWWDHVRAGGLMLFHDYSPETARAPSPRVVEAVNDMARAVGRVPDVLIIDSDAIGMAGFYRRRGHPRVAQVDGLTE